MWLVTVYSLIWVCGKTWWHMTGKWYRLMLWEIRTRNTDWLRLQKASWREYLPITMPSFSSCVLLPLACNVFSRGKVWELISSGALIIEKPLSDWRNLSPRKTKFRISKWLHLITQPTSTSPWLLWSLLESPELTRNWLCLPLTTKIPRNCQWLNSLNWELNNCHRRLKRAKKPYFRKLGNRSDNSLEMTLLTTFWVFKVKIMRT